LRKSAAGAGLERPAPAEREATMPPATQPKNVAGPALTPSAERPLKSAKSVPVAAALVTA